MIFKRHYATFARDTAVNVAVSVPAPDVVVRVSRFQATAGAYNSVSLFWDLGGPAETCISSITGGSVNLTFDVADTTTTFTGDGTATLSLRIENTSHADDSPIIGGAYSFTTDP